MNKILLQAKSKEEAENLLKSTVALTDNETYIIKEVKKPCKFLFFESKGKYEITILGKDEFKEKKEVKKEIKKEVKKEVVVEKSEDKLTKTLKDFVKALNLDIKISSIEKKNNLVFVNLEGKDVKYVIGEKGVALNAMEYLFNSVKEFKDIRLIFDANNYREKRDKSLIAMANKKAKKVIETKSFIKLYPMSSKERRVIHEELSKYSNIETKSHGIEPKRYLVIKYIGEK